MQPNRNSTDWQQPSEQPSPAPMVTGEPASAQPVPQAPTFTPPSAQQQPSSDPLAATQPSIDASPLPVQPTQVSAQPIQAPEPSQPLELVNSPVAQEPISQDPALVQQSPDTQDAAVEDEEQPVYWQATEYIHHDKSPLWFVIFGVVVVALIAVALFVLQSITFAILIPVMAVALIVYSYRPPHPLDYTLSKQGLHVNDRLYSFSEFKGFGVIHDGGEYSVMLIPTKRFRPGVSVYFPEEAGEAIVDMLGSRLPMQELKADIVDKVIRKLRI